MKLMTLALMALTLATPVRAEIAGQPTTEPAVEPLGVQLDKPFKNKRCSAAPAGLRCPMSAVPKPYDGGEDVLIFMQDGLVAGVRMFILVDDNEYGDKTRAKYDELKGLLVKKYGEPELTNERLKVGSIWSEPRDWLMGLKLNERALAAKWALKTRAVLVQAKYAGPGKTMLVVSWASTAALEKATHSDNAKKAEAL